MSEHWRTVKVREEYLKQIEKLLKSSLGKKLGIITPGQFVNDAIKERLSRVELNRFEHFNLHENIIRVLDLDIGETGDIVELFLNNNSLGCGTCGKSDCVHTKFVFTDPELSKKLIKKGVKSPFI